MVSYRMTPQDWDAVHRHSPQPQGQGGDFHPRRHGASASTRPRSDNVVEAEAPMELEWISCSEAWFTTDDFSRPFSRYQRK